jgi:rhamnogalacturonyl hydrolase YesR
MKQNKMFNFAFLLVAFAFASTMPALAQGTDYFSDLPQGATPQEVGKKLADHFVTGPIAPSPRVLSPQMASLPPYMRTIGYAEIGTWYGALNFAQLTKDEALQKQLIARFDLLMPGGAEAAKRPQRRHVDDSIFGVVPLEIAIETKDPKYLTEGLWWADRQWENPQPDGLSAETRFWVDDMYMLTMLQLQAYRATGDRKYIDRLANEMVAYLDKLQQPNGLFYHAPDVPFFWGRGNGWFAAGMAEMLRTLPKDHPQRPRIEAGYKSMMAALLKYQGKDGMWRQLIDHEEAWPESSSSAMFTFALITGVKNGWLDGPTYGPAARKGWLAIAGYIDQNSDVTQVCAGTSKLNNLEYYLARPRRTGDFHGQAPILWSVNALLR